MALEDRVLSRYASAEEVPGAFESSSSVQSALSGDPLVLWRDALLRPTLHSNVHGLHHLDLTTTSKLLIAMSLIHLVLDVNLHAEGLLHLVLEPDSPAGLLPRLKLKITVT